MPVIATVPVRYLDLQHDDVLVALDGVVLPEAVTLAKPDPAGRSIADQRGRVLASSIGSVFLVRRELDNPPAQLDYCGCRGPHHGGTHWCPTCFDRDWRGTDNDAQLTYRKHRTIGQKPIDVLRLMPAVGLDRIATGYDVGQTLGGLARRDLVVCTPQMFPDPFTGSPRRAYRITVDGRAFLRGRDLVEAQRAAAQARKD